MKPIVVRLSILFLLTVFMVSLAYFIGERLSSEAMAVLLGVIAGVSASIPTSLIIVWVATRSMNVPQMQSVTRTAAKPVEDRIVVVNPQPQVRPQPMVVDPPATYPGRPPAYAQSPYAQPPQRHARAPQVTIDRQFTVIGDTQIAGLGENQAPVSVPVNH